MRISQYITWGIIATCFSIMVLTFLMGKFSEHLTLPQAWILGLFCASFSGLLAGSISGQIAIRIGWGKKAKRLLGASGGFAIFVTTLMFWRADIIDYIVVPPLPPTGLFDTRPGPSVEVEPKGLEVIVRWHNLPEGSDVRYLLQADQKRYYAPIPIRGSSDHTKITPGADIKYVAIASLSSDLLPPHFPNEGVLIGDERISVVVASEDVSR